MKKYKEIYENLTSDIDNQKNKKEEIDTELKSLKKEQEITSLKETEIMVEIEDLKEERRSITNKKTKPIVIIANTILALLLVAAVYLETSILSTISSVGKKILTGIGLFIGFGNIYMCALIGVLIGRDNIIEKIQNKYKTNERYIELTERLKEKNKELANIREEKQIITEKTIEKENEIQEIVNQLKLNTEELEKLKEKIISLVTSENTEVINDVAEINETKPYTRTKIKEN